MIPVENEYFEYCSCFYSFLQVLLLSSRVVSVFVPAALFVLHLINLTAEFHTGLVEFLHVLLCTCANGKSSLLNLEKNRRLRYSSQYVA